MFTSDEENQHWLVRAVKSVFLGRWFYFYLLAFGVDLVFAYCMGVAANYNVMKFLEDGYNPETEEWNPSPPLESTFSPSLQWAKDFSEAIRFEGDETGPHSRDKMFMVVGVLTTLPVFCLGRLDLLWHMTLVRSACYLGKVMIGFMLQTPHAGDAEIAINDLGGQEEYKKWRTRGYYENLFHTGVLSCADMLYSGHTVVLTSFVWMGIKSMSEAKLPHRRFWFWLVSSILVLGCLGCSAMIVLMRSHYTIDVLLAWLMLHLFTMHPWIASLAKIINAYWAAGKYKPPTIEWLFQSDNEVESDEDETPDLELEL